MKSSSDVDLVTKESSVIMCRAAELFIQTLAGESYKNINNAKKMDYKNVAEVVHSQDRYIFLREMMPKKITVAEYKKILERKYGSIPSSDKNEKPSTSVSSPHSDKNGKPSTSVSSSDSEADSSSDSSEASSASE